MKVSPHFVLLYNKTVRRYRKLTGKLQKQISAGQFQKYSHYTQHDLLYQLRKLTRKLRDLRFQLKIAVATGTVVLVLGSSQVKAQAPSTLGPFTLQKRSENPLRGPLIVGRQPSPAIVDLDNDGDYDLVVGDRYGALRYFQNVGTKENAVYDELTESENPFSNLSIGAYYLSPAFIDFDKDGDQDMFIGTYDTIQYWVNTGSATAPSFTLAETNPLSTTPSSIGPISLAFADMDNDGDSDVLIGGNYSPHYQSIFYYENLGDGTFSSSFIGVNPNSTNAAAAVADIDKDGDLEIVTGAQYGDLRVFTWNGEGYTELTGTDNPFYQKGVGYFTSPTFGDMDNDGDMDLIVGYGNYGNTGLTYFQNQGNGTFTEIKDTTNPFGGIDVGRQAIPTLIDFDKDGDLDALIGNKYGSEITYYRNDNGTYSLITGNEDPFKDLGLTGYFTPNLIDLDNDGDLDIVSGDYSGRIYYFQNTGEGYNTIYPAEGPFNGIDAGWDAFVDMTDIDGDGDFDVLIGTGSGDIVFYRNTGTKSVPAFTLVDKTQSPFAAIDYNYDAVINFTDVDHDGDFDLIIGTYISNDETFVIDYYENTGTPTSPVFVLSDNQFMPDVNGGLQDPNPGLYDIDGDGDLDLFIGRFEGDVLYSKNENPAVVTTVNQTPLDLSVKPGDQPIVIDKDLTLADADNDKIVGAKITIEGFQKGQVELTFTLQGAITGTFNQDSGALFLTGKATLAEYQAALRTVAAVFPAGGGGAKAIKKQNDYTRNIKFEVFDIDHTNPAAVSRAVTFTEGNIVVFNAVAPHSSGDNQWMRIHNLPAENKVSIFNRWGDKVYEAKNYDSALPGKRFEGLTDSGKELATGTYFYKIEFSGKTVTGYLSLKQ
jgi:hypothetical protein